MKILYLTNELNYADGVASHLFYLINNFDADIKSGIYLMAGGGSAIEKFNKLGVEVLTDKNVLHSKRDIKSFASAVFSIHKFIKANDINLVHSHNHYAAAIAEKAVKLTGAKTIQTVHGLFPEQGRLKHFNSGHYIAVNDHVSDHLLNKKIPDTQITLIYNGVDFGKQKRNKNIDNIRVISASRLEKGKGIEIFLKAVAKIPDTKRSNIEFLIAGSGSLEPELTRLNEKLKTRVIFIGNSINLREDFEKTHIFVLTSESEGLPITLLEAASEYNLIVSSDFNGIKNILTDKKEGLIFKMNDADDLASKLSLAFDNIQLLIEYTEAFHKKASVKFNAVVMAESHQKLYKNILDD